MHTQPSPYSDSSLRVYVRKTKANRRNQNSSPVAAKPLKVQLYDLSTLNSEEWEKSRLCWYCELPFSPRIKSAWKSHFCCTEHRMAYNKYGKLPFEKIMLALRQEITKQIEARTLADWNERAERIVESRIQARKRELESYIRQTVARFIKDPAKALRELDAVEAGVKLPENTPCNVL